MYAYIQSQHHADDDDDDDDDDHSLYTVIIANVWQVFTTVTCSGVKAADWINEILCIHNRRLNYLIVGLDAEWRPSYISAQNPIAVLQLCVGRRCLVFQICHADSIPGSLFTFLSDVRFRFVGVGIGGDANRLYDEQGLRVANTVDLRTLAANAMGRQDLAHAGLARIAQAVLNVRLQKPRRVTLSNWENEDLSPNQISYACADAFISFELGRRLFSGEF